MPRYHEMRGEVNLRGTHRERKWVVWERALPPGPLVAHWPPLGSRGQLRRSERTPVHAPQTDCLAPGAAEGVCTGVQATTTATIAGHHRPLRHQSGPWPSHRVQLQLITKWTYADLCPVLNWGHLMWLMLCLSRYINSQPWFGRPG